MKKAVIFILILILIAIGAAYWAQRVGKPEFEAMADQLFEAVDTQAAQTMYSKADFEQVPEVAVEYLKRALPEVGVRTRVVRITETGRIKMAEDSSWDDFSSRQMSGVDPPRLVWAAEADWAPLMPVMTLMAYTGEKGFVRSYFWGMVEGFANGGLVIKAYLMQRWLGEAVWYPDALLPSARLRWERADTKVKGVKVARVILEDDGIKVSGQFFFGGGGAPMFFLGDPLPFGHLAGQRWYCQYSDWRRQGDRQIPFELIQGVREGISDDRRLEITLQSIDYR